MKENKRTCISAFIPFMTIDRVGFVVQTIMQFTSKLRLNLLTFLQISKNKSL